MKCKDCSFVECLMKTDKDFDICPVEIAKRRYEENHKDSANKK